MERYIKHPSGRPIRRPERKSMSIIRNPGTGPLLPRLREPEPKDLIGFHRMRPAGDQDE